MQIKRSTNQSFCTSSSATFALAAFCVFLPSAVQAQAPPGPLPGAEPQAAPASAAKPQPQKPEVPPRQTILGAWKFNQDESDDPRKKMQEARGGDQQGGYGGRGRMGGGYPGGGYPGGGYPGGGYPGGGRGGYGGRGGENDEQQGKMRELLTPASQMTLSMTGAEVDLVDDQNRKRAFMTDGRKLKKSKDDNYQEIAAKWDGNRLVSEEKDPRSNKMSRTLELSGDGRQLYETLHMTAGRNNTPVDIRYVYDIAGESK